MVINKLLEKPARGLAAVTTVAALAITACAPGQLFGVGGPLQLCALYQYDDPTAPNYAPKQCREPSEPPKIPEIKVSGYKQN